MRPGTLLALAAGLLVAVALFHALGLLPLQGRVRAAAEEEFAQATSDTTAATTTATIDSNKAAAISMPRIVPGALRKRDDLADILNALELTRGAELGVLKGEFAERIVKSWPRCTYYLLVDAWAKLENYDDLNNKEDAVMLDNKNAALARMQSFSAREGFTLDVCQNFTTTCALRVPDASLDFVYVDARHDYKGVLADLHAWWPKLRDGGVMAGHDFLNQNDVKSAARGRKPQRWDINFDGTVDEQGRAVKGAVEEFFGDAAHPERYRQLAVTYQDWPYSWVVRK